MSKFNYTDARRARSLQNAGNSNETIVSLLNGKYTIAEIDWLLAELRSKNAKYSKSNYAHNDWAYLLCSERQFEPPPEVLAERDHRATLVPASVTARLCGDPLPGLSALDQLMRESA